MNRRLVWVAALCWWVAIAAGCQDGWESDYRQLGLVEVSGRVTMDGKPMSAATILFECPDKTYSYGELDENGNYRLMFNSSQSGVLPGPKTVRIRAGGAGEEGPVEGGQQKITRPRAVIPPCYGVRSKLTATIQGRSQTVNFDLKSNCSVTGPTP